MTEAQQRPMDIQQAAAVAEKALKTEAQQRIEDDRRARREARHALWRSRGSRPLFLVVGESGEYSDWTSWVSEGLLDGAQAELLAARRQMQHDLLFTVRDEWDLPYSVREHADKLAEAAGFDLGSNRAEYHVEEVELRGAGSAVDDGAMAALQKALVAESARVRRLERVFEALEEELENAPTDARGQPTQRVRRMMDLIERGRRAAGFE